MSDSAKGPSAGYIYQFELALLQLARLEQDEEYVTIEDVDDVASHAEDGTVLITVQAKHSIAKSGTTFQDTSYALWRTIQLWIEKNKKGLFNDKTEFHCSTNKVVPTDSLLHKFCNDDQTKSIEEVKSLLDKQKEKLKAKKAKEPEQGEHIEKIISLMEYALDNESDFERILKSIKIVETSDEKTLFLSELQLGTDKIKQEQKDSVYHTFLGWIVAGSKDKWRNDTEARFSKKMLAEKWYYVRETPSIMRAVFREKKEHSINMDLVEDIKNNLFVRQIEDIKRNEDAKKRIIQQAIHDYISAEVEIAHIVKEGIFTNSDFENFNRQCQEAWQSYFDQEVLKEIHEYSEDDIHSIAIRIYDHIMKNIQLSFNEAIEFTNYNVYVRNGTFLKLSDKPSIGWRPDWNSKYSKD
jgi:hypothetical protein